MSDLRDDVELELVRQLVRDQAVQPIRRIVDRHQHPLAASARRTRRRLPARRRASTFCCSNSLWVLKRISGTLTDEVVLAGRR